MSATKAIGMRAFDRSYGAAIHEVTINGRHLIVTSNGTPVVAIIAADEYDRLLEDRATLAHIQAARRQAAEREARQ